MSPNKQIHASQFQILCALSEKVALKINVTKRLIAIYKNMCAMIVFTDRLINTLMGDNLLDFRVNKAKKLLKTHFYLRYLL